MHPERVEQSGPKQATNTVPTGEGDSADGTGGAGGATGPPVDPPLGSGRPEHRHGVRGLFPLSIRSSLVVVVLIPLVIVVVLASTLVVHQASARSQAVRARQSSLVLDSLLQARVAIYDEYIPSAARVAASLYGISLDQVDKLLGVNFQANLAAARKAVDGQAIFKPGGVLASDHRSLELERARVDHGTVTLAKVQSFFGTMGVSIDTRWQQTFDNLKRDDASTS